MAKVLYKKGSLTAYNALTTKDANTLYLLYSTTDGDYDRLYLGDKLISERPFVSATFADNTITIVTGYNADGSEVSATVTLGSAASKTAGTAAGNVPTIGTALGTTANVPIVNDGTGKLKPHASGVALGTAAFDNSTSFATAAQGTLAANAMPKSGGAFTGVVTLKANPTTALGAATKQYVDEQISTGIAASDAMVFKGTLGTSGTVTALPTTNVKLGDTYKVITAGTYAGQVCKIGDLLVATAGGTSPTWAYVPSGDEATTFIKYGTSGVTLSTTPQTGTVTVGEAAIKQVDATIAAGSTSVNLPTSKAVNDFVLSKGYTANVGTITGVTAGAGLTGGGTSGTVALALTATGVTASTYGEQGGTKAFGGTIKIPYITVDANGRITAAQTKTATLPSPTIVSSSANGYMTSTLLATLNEVDAATEWGTL